MRQIPFNLQSQLQNATTELIGERCWFVSAGPNTGSVINLHFGKRIPRIYPGSRQSKTPRRGVIGSIQLFVECAWRLDSADSVVCGCRDSSLPDGEMLSGLSLIEGQKVMDVDLRLPSCDLSVAFANDLRLGIFCDQVNPVDQGDNYWISTPSYSVAVGVRSVLQIVDATPSPL